MWNCTIEGGELKDFNTLSIYFKKRYNINIDKSVEALDFKSVKEGLTDTMVEGFKNKLKGM